MNMQIEQFVMAYEAEQDRLRALLPEGFVSLRPVLRINAEIREGEHTYVEFNTPVARGGNRGWLNVAFWEDAVFSKEGSTTTFRLPQLEISFNGTGLQGGCPAEKDNCGCYFPGKEDWQLRVSESVDVNKEYCDCRFRWLQAGGAEGVSQGKTLPAYPTEIKQRYPRAALTAENAAAIPCAQVLGAYVVRFQRSSEASKIL